MCNFVCTIKCLFLWVGQGWTLSIALCMFNIIRTRKLIATRGEWIAFIVKQLTIGIQITKILHNMHRDKYKKCCGYFIIHVHLLITFIELKQNLNPWKHLNFNYNEYKLNILILMKMFNIYVICLYQIHPNIFSKFQKNYVRE